jgi:hypothetical protein
MSRKIKSTYYLYKSEYHFNPFYFLSQRELLNNNNVHVYVCPSFVIIFRPVKEFS